MVLNVNIPVWCRRFRAFSLPIFCGLRHELLLTYNKAIGAQVFSRRSVINAHENQKITFGGFFMLKAISVAENIWWVGVNDR
ncbi:MAG: hypothetical protein J6H20_04095, partial [Pyramidobacter sp.]|nr:hypothetical protein [Pyramidobacter sp.]